MPFLDAVITLDSNAALYFITIDEVENIGPSLINTGAVFLYVFHNCF